LTSTGYPHSSLQQRPPLSADGLRIGLLGGSFNPPHEAHRAISLFALKRLQLDRMWWLVSPGNPLKDVSALPDLAERIAAAKKLANDPRIVVTGIEANLGTRYTVDTIAELRRRWPVARFVWVMGADNLTQFNRWRSWQKIASLVPIAVIDRPSDSLRASASPAAQRLARYRLEETRANGLADCAPPAWVFLRGLKLPLSSTQLRQRQRR
jgi:nicotinate-nucleotide adenylyltransferase